MAELENLTVAQLDELAALNEVADYPAGGNKAEKVAALEAALEDDHQALEAAGLEEETYRLQLAESFFEEGVTPVASFMVSDERGTRSVTLHEGATFETTDRSVYVGLRDLPFLEEVG